MAIKIIKQGRIPEKRFRVTCKRCGTIYEFLDEDAHYEYDDKERQAKYGINCPVCNEFTYAYEKDILLKARV